MKERRRKPKENKDEKASRFLPASELVFTAPVSVFLRHGPVITAHIPNVTDLWRVCRIQVIPSPVKSRHADAYL